MTGIDVVQCSSVDNREDLDGLAALIEVCDLVVSITNVTVHLAGAAKEHGYCYLMYQIFGGCQTVPLVFGILVLRYIVNQH